MKKISTTQYLIALIATLAIFVGALYASSYVNQRKTEELRSIEDKIAVDIISLEAQADLATATSCESFDDSDIREDLDELNSRLIFMEDEVGEDNPDLFRLKRYYSLLEIKHYLVSKKISAECKKPAVHILYFYPTKDCDECVSQEYMLRAIQQQYPQANIYTFDYTLDLPAIQTLISLHNIPENPPIMDINGTIYPPFEKFSTLRSIVTSLLEATSTPKTSVKAAI